MLAWGIFLCYNRRIDSNKEDKMTTVAQMIEWMKTLPQEAVVECGVEVSEGYITYMTMQPVDIDACDVLDYTSEASREKYPTLAGEVIIVLRVE